MIFYSLVSGEMKFFEPFSTIFTFVVVISSRFVEQIIFFDKRYFGRFHIDVAANQRRKELS